MDAQGTLIIQGVAPEDAGNYSCQAANEVGTDEETVTLYYAGTRAKGICRRGVSSLPPPSSRLHENLLSICCMAGSGDTAVDTGSLSGAAYALTGEHSGNRQTVK